jgi:hypothetical protein
MGKLNITISKNEWVPYPVIPIALTSNASLNTDVRQNSQVYSFVFEFEQLRTPDFTLLSTMTQP